jgi:hypothetical protein
MKRGIFLIFVFLFSFNFISAVDLAISSEAVVDTIINDQGKPAVFEFTITNNEVYEEFSVYIFERFELSQDSFVLSKGQTTKLQIEFLPYGSMTKNNGHVYVPVYFVNKGGKDPMIIEVVIETVDFDKALGLNADSITIDSDFLDVNFYNLENINYENLDVVFSSVFIDDFSQSFSLSPFEVKNFKIPLSNDKLKKLVYGDYVLSAKIVNENYETKVDRYVTITEKAGLSKSEEKEGLIIRRIIIEKTNEGNVPTIADIYVNKDVLSRLFTSFSVQPSKVERSGLKVNYIWQKELLPNETLKVKVTTNWFYPLILILLIFVIIYVLNNYFRSHLVIRKNVSFVKTKSGEFALRVNLRIKARKFMEKVIIRDRLPAMAKFYEHYGSPPTILNKETGRLQWDFKHLAEGEERVLSYIFYSKIKVLGKFELPSATGVYEIQGNLHESQSNKTFFINEPEKSKKPMIEDF